MATVEELLTKLIAETKMTNSFVNLLREEVVGLRKELKEVKK